MRVDDLLEVQDLGLELVWGEPALLNQPISGVTATDLLDPSSFLEPGEVVLSGLVWWTARGGRGRADHFVSSLQHAGAVALLAGTVRHGGIPDEVVRACRAHGLALVAVPEQTTFRTITDAIYLRRWSDLSSSPHSSLPEHVRRRLDRLIRDRAEPGLLLDEIAGQLGGSPCALVTASGRTIARSTRAAADSPPAAIVRGLRRADRTVAQLGSAEVPYDSWFVTLDAGREAPPRRLQDVAEVLRGYRELWAQDEAGRQRAADELLTGLLDGATDAETTAALESCGLPRRGTFRVVCGATTPFRRADSIAAVRELLSHMTDRPCAVGAIGEHAFAVLADLPALTERLSAVYELVRSCDPQGGLHLGVGAATADPRDSLAQALHACRTSAGLERSITATEELATLHELLAGVPAAVRTAYARRVLGVLLEDDPGHAGLRDTLSAFLDHNGSWARTAEALFVHVNTVHYRIERVEKVTGRDLAKLADRVDLRAALLCARTGDAAPDATAWVTVGLGG
ncbi:hypothetical protein ABIA39_007303 [Nocardia sp. GAS34]|uniref:PucR family transcriptional regulator n=1 Tax=unclassified Nocardia TaxID=2637762 RepID=UPI003D200D27